MVPNEGYEMKSNYSQDSIRWLDFVAETEGIKILLALNGRGEQKIGRYFVDGFCPENNSINIISKPSDSTAKASPPITNLPIPSSPSVAPVSEEALASPDFTDFQLVRNKKKLKKDSPTKTNNSIAKAEKISKFYTSSRCEVLNTVPTKDNICAHQSALKPSETKKPTSVDTQLLPMAVLPPLEKTVLQSRESDADAEMSSTSLSEEDALEYNMSEDLEDSPAVSSPPPSSKPEKAHKYKNR
ncbi:hypothetical protein AVEN_24897-1 [Araneus ventricosus]|uniref:Uncharacterized protein n=1 Tax=Araneus ventricosus TaxID=182803 RepID=A0A4Y2QR67_ARAVE|nr:hypothetical protein AVEN_24897-1 [Araneus ventricosus]